MDHCPRGTRDGDEEPGDTPAVGRDRLLIPAVAVAIAESCAIQRARTAIQELRDETDALRGGEPFEPAPPAAGALPDDHE